MPILDLPPTADAAAPAAAAPHAAGAHHGHAAPGGDASAPPTQGIVDTPQAPAAGAGHAAPPASAGATGAVGKVLKMFGGAMCFPGTARILSSAGSLEISSLKIGDRVLTCSSSGPRFSPVISFLHREVNYPGNFLLLYIVITEKIIRIVVKFKFIGY